MAGLTLILAVILILGRFFGGYWPQWESTIAASGRAGYAWFAGSFILLTTLCFPVSVLGFSAGAMFGPVRGLLLLFPCGLMAGMLMFLIARWIVRGRIRSLVQSRPRLATLDGLARRQAFRLNLLTRLSPFNYGLASYTLASGSTTFRAYLGGLLGTLPSMTAHVVLGHVAAGQALGVHGWAGGGPVRWLVLGLGILFLGLLAWTAGRMLQQARQKAVDPLEPECTTGRTVQNDSL